MSYPSAIHTVKTAITKSTVPKFNPATLKRPSALPQRPLEPNRFRRPLGLKKIYLPNFVLTLIRSPHLPPHYASFMTPLWFNKLDLKDYLFNLYGLQCLNIRSYVIQSKVRQDKPGVRVPRPRKWFRPASRKKMTVELVHGEPGNGPFIWPAEPEDMSPWGKRNSEQMIEHIKNERKSRAERSEKWPTDMGTLATKARQMVREVRKQAEEEKGKIKDKRDVKRKAGAL